MFLKITDSKINHKENSSGLLITMEYIIVLPSGELLKIKGEAKMYENFIKQLFDAEKMLKDLIEQQNKTYDSRSYVAASSPYFLRDKMKEEEYNKSSLDGKRALLDEWIRQTEKEIKSLDAILKNKDLVKSFECHNLEFEYQSRSSDGWVTFGDSRISFFDHGVLDFKLKNSTNALLAYFDDLKKIDTICKEMVLSSVSKYFNINPVFSF